MVPEIHHHAQSWLKFRFFFYCSCIWARRKYIVSFSLFLKDKTVLYRWHLKTCSRTVSVSSRLDWCIVLSHWDKNTNETDRFLASCWRLCNKVFKHLCQYLLSCKIYYTWAVRGGNRQGQLHAFWEFQIPLQSLFFLISLQGCRYRHLCAFAYVRS